jgi:hypothetical protein
MTLEHTLRDNIATITLERLTIRVIMLEARQSYGKWQIKITPAHGATTIEGGTVGQHRTTHSLRTINRRIPSRQHPMNQLDIAHNYIKWLLDKEENNDGRTNEQFKDFMIEMGATHAQLIEFWKTILP